jgi:hypothetical protein
MTPKSPMWVDMRGGSGISTPENAMIRQQV